MVDIVHLIVFYAFLGGSIKYIDQAYDEKAFSIRSAKVLAVLAGVVMGYLMAQDSPFSTAFFAAMLISLVIARKIDNFAFAIGYSNASWTLKVDLTAEYVTKLLNHMHNTGMQQVTIDGTNAERSEAPLFGLNSGYINRAADRMPSQGATFPWRVKMSYLADYNAMKRKPYLDEYTKFTNPKRSKVSA